MHAQQDLTTHWPPSFFFDIQQPLAIGGSDTEIPSTKKHALFTKRDATEWDWSLLSCWPGSIGLFIWVIINLD
jgi:hypothetical protein